MSNDSYVSSKPRVLVLCFDGTANEFNDKNTNVVKLYSMLTKDRPAEQLTYYQAGIGTYFDPGIVSPVFNWGAKVLDDATAWNLGDHVRDGYHFLMQNYREGDKISLFGFSRGAYTARALAGFLYKIGLLSRDNTEGIPFAYKIYERTDEQGIRLSRKFKEAFCRPVAIDFVGVWDTVASVGLLGRNLPFTRSNAGIKIFRHALSLDEHRAKFQPNTYQCSEREPKEKSAGLKSDHSNHSDPTFLRGMSNKVRSKFAKMKKTLKDRSSAWKSKPSTMPDYCTISSDDRCDTDVLETWFAGCHSDVGGGNVSDTEGECLSNVPLRWMVSEVLLSECGVKFDSRALRKAHIDTNPRHDHPKSEPCEYTETATTDDDVRSLHDELKACVFWWILEVIPSVRSSWQDYDGKWHNKWGFNRGRGRKIDVEHPNFHVSVRRRMEDSKLKYTPRACWEPGTEVYIGHLSDPEQQGTIPSTK